jgi:hypothetical protein
MESGVSDRNTPERTDRIMLLCFRRILNPSDRIQPTGFHLGSCIYKANMVAAASGIFVRGLSLQTLQSVILIRNQKQLDSFLRNQKGSSSGHRFVEKTIFFRVYDSTMNDYRFSIKL